MKSRRRLLLLAFALLLLLVWFFPALVTQVTDWWWFREIGYQVVFTTQLVTRIWLFILVGGLAGGWLYLNLRVAQRGLAPVPFHVPVGGGGAGMINLTSLVRRITLPFAVVMALLVGLGASTSWDMVLQFVHGVAFGTRDPVFGRDIGYYVFTLPAIDAVVGMVRGLTATALFLVIPIYWIRGDIIAAPPRRLIVEPGTTKHLAGLLAVLFVTTAVRLWFVTIPGLLYSTTGPLVGASYTDLHATLPMLQLSAVVALVAAGIVIAAGIKGHLLRGTAWAVGGYLAVVLIGRGLFPLVMQKLLVAPTELTRETPYLRDHIAATRAAWGLDSVDVRDLGDAGNLSLADIRANAPTIDNVRLWDRDPLLQTFGQLQEIRTYYEFVNVDDDRYWIDGKYRQVLLAPRELNAAALPTRTFINEHLTFTHGMGLTVAPVNQVTSEGLPVLFVKDIPPTSTVSLKVTRPQIYYGEDQYDYAFVGTKQREFDHPAGDANVYDRYAGTGGVRVGNLWRRLLLAIRFGSSNIFFSGDISDDSKVLYYRNIVDRVNRALPFLTFDHDPYLVVAADGKLKWMLDGYTATDRYPYSARSPDGLTYMRNSVKVVIDAYDGSLKAYISASHDPLIRTWAAILPGIFHPLDSMPADLRAHIRYPDELYTLQTRLYTTYHMDSPVDFYQRNDQWQIPAVDESTGAVPFMRHIVMRLPEEKQAEYIYMVPFTQRGKDNLSAWMVARNDGAEYGKLRVYRLPRQILVYGPSQVEARINQDTDISRQISLWDQRGSKVVRGDLLVIPIEQSLLYVQPLYLQADKGRIPELKRVVVAYGDQVVMDETLDGALATMFGGVDQQRPTPAPAATTGATAGGADTQFRIDAAEARRHFQAAIEAQRNGDWAKYGEELKLLGQFLDRIAAPK
ncbi:MAG: UPF0182 family protein [Gemmatimonadales bacterium]